MEQRHLSAIREMLSHDLGRDELELIPTRYELVGDILLISIPDALRPKRRIVAAAFKEVLDVASVMEKRFVEGEYRIPAHDLLVGTRTETVHRENGIRYSIDLSSLMFSSGNINERIRMSRVDDIGPVIDMFAGIGYFSLPIAKYVRSPVVSLEKNPVAYRYLEKNIALNRLGSLITPLNIDCREYGGPSASRIVMGYVGSTHRFLPAAYSLARDGCIIHYHQTVPAKSARAEVERQLAEASRDTGVTADVQALRMIKKYSPGVVHVVADVMVSRQGASAT
jgi:tRNA wybutosine-synthesizing protein 2